MATLDIELQVSGPGTRPLSECSEEIRDGLAALRRAFEDDVDFRRHAGFGVLEDCDLIRFLLARECDVDKTVAMLKRALTWRSKRMPYWLLVDPDSDVAQVFAQENRTGKLFALGRDQHGRGLLVMDSSCENTVDDDTHMRFLAYMVEAARRACSPGVDKICVVINLENFSIRNSVSRTVIMEAIEILTIAFPETLGSCILWQPPSYAYWLFSMFKPFLDPRTLQKVLFVCTPPDLGGEADCQMIEAVGPDWRELTGLVSERKERGYSEYFGSEILAARGFEFEQYWKSRLLADAESAAKFGGPPWTDLPKELVLDPAQWDGAHPEFWSANLLTRQPLPTGKVDESINTDDEIVSEALDSPTQSECQGSEKGSVSPTKCGGPDAGSSRASMTCSTTSPSHNSDIGG